MKKLLLIFFAVSIFSATAEAIIEKPTKLVKISPKALTKKIYKADKKLMECLIHRSITKNYINNAISDKKLEKDSKIMKIMAIRYMLLDLVKNTKAIQDENKYNNYAYKIKKKYRRLANGKYHRKDAKRVTRTCNAIIRNPLKKLKLNKYIREKRNTNQYLNKIAKSKPWKKKLLN